MNVEVVPQSVQLQIEDPYSEAALESEKDIIDVGPYSYLAQKEVPIRKIEMLKQQGYERPLEDYGNYSVIEAHITIMDAFRKILGEKYDDSTIQFTFDQIRYSSADLFSPENAFTKTHIDGFGSFNDPEFNHSLRLMGFYISSTPTEFFKKPFNFRDVKKDGTLEFGWDKSQTPEELPVERLVIVPSSLPHRRPTVEEPIEDRVIMRWGLFLPKDL